MAEIETSNRDNGSLVLKRRSVDGWCFPTVEFSDNPKPLLVRVSGDIQNWSQGTKKERGSEINGEGMWQPRL